MAEKRKNNKKAAAIIIIVMLIIAAVVFLYIKGYIHFGKISETTPQTTISQTADNNETTGSNESVSDSANSSDTQQQTNSQPEASNNNGGEYNPALPLTVNDAFDILKQKYGSDSRINMSASNEQYHNFTIIKNGELYATVRVNLSTGEAEETITATEKVNKFNLV